MIYELRTYTLIPGKQPQYLKLNGEVGRKVRGDKYGKFEGGWTTEFGTINQYVHLWGYADLEERNRLRAQETKILSAALPLQPPKDTGNIYELRWYRTQVGRAGEWLDLFKAVMPTREKYMRRVGLWQTELGQLNEVVHMWVYRDLNERMTSRAKLGQDPEWQKFIAASAPLLAHMQAIVLVPTPASPMA